MKILVVDKKFKQRPEFAALRKTIGLQFLEVNGELPYDELLKTWPTPPPSPNAILLLAHIHESDGIDVDGVAQSMVRVCKRCVQEGVRIVLYSGLAKLGQIGATHVDSLFATLELDGGSRGMHFCQLSTAELDLTYLTHLASESASWRVERLRRSAKTFDDLVRLRDALQVILWSSTISATGTFSHADELLAERGGDPFDLRECKQPLIRFAGGYELSDIDLRHGRRGFAKLCAWINSGRALSVEEIETERDELSHSVFGNSFWSRLHNEDPVAIRKIKAFVNKGSGEEGAVDDAMVVSSALSLWPGIEGRIRTLLSTKIEAAGLSFTDMGRRLNDSLCGSTGFLRLMSASVEELQHLREGDQRSKEEWLSAELQTFFRVGDSIAESLAALKRCHVNGFFGRFLEPNLSWRKPE